MYENEHQSMKAIANVLHISPTTVLSVLRRQHVTRRTISDAVSIKYEKVSGIARCVPLRVLNPHEEHLKIAGVMLYWGEGTKAIGGVRFANSDPHMITLFLSFLRTVCKVHDAKIRAIVHRYPDNDQEELESFWIKITGLRKEQFYPQYVHVGKPGTYGTRTQYGTISIMYNDTRLQREILKWMDEYGRKLLQ